MTLSPSLPTGIVLNYQSNFYTVKVSEGEYQCFLKGTLKKEGTDVVVGDEVVVDSLDEANSAGRIVQVLPRQNQLSRPKIANITKVLIVAAIDSPPLELIQLDRFVTQALISGVTPLICISKRDLAASPAAIESIKAIYEPLQIPVLATSIREPETVKALFQAIAGEIVVLAGLSGVGKSSLLNAYQPGLSLAVREVSGKLQRGQHTTRSVSLIALERGTYVADSPGFSYLRFDTVLPETVEAAFPDFAPFRDECYFDNCLHRDEVDCNVQAHAEKIASSRMESYQTFLDEAFDYQELAQKTSQKNEATVKTLHGGKTGELQIIKLSGKQRQASRRTQKQRLSDWGTEDDTLDE